MSAKSAVWNQVHSILANDVTLSGYVNKVYDGIRLTTGIDLNNFPCICLEPRSAPEEGSTVHYNNKISFTIDIYAFVYVTDIDKQIIGVAPDGTKGILDFDDDIKNALWKYPDLNNTCVMFTLSDTVYDFFSEGNQGMRTMKISITIDLRVTKDNR